MAAEAVVAGATRPLRDQRVIHMESKMKTKKAPAAASVYADFETVEDNNGHDMHFVRVVVHMPDGRILIIRETAYKSRSDAMRYYDSLRTGKLLRAL